MLLHLGLCLCNGPHLVPLEPAKALGLVWRIEFLQRTVHTLALMESLQLRLVLACRGSALINIVQRLMGSLNSSNSMTVPLHVKFAAFLVDSPPGVEATVVTSCCSDQTKCAAP